MGLSKMAIIAASTRKPRTAMPQISNVATVLAPTLVAIIQGRKLFGAVSRLLGIRARWLVWHILYVGLMASKSLAVVGKVIWETRSVRRLRKKLVFEFFTLILGFGNPLCLMLFWPGWWVLGFIMVLATKSYMSVDDGQISHGTQE